MSGKNTSPEGEAALATSQKASRSTKNKNKYKGLLGCIKKRCCYTGLLIIRKYRWLLRIFEKLLDVFFSIANKFKHRAIYSLRLFLVRNGISFEFLTDMLRSLKAGSAAAKKKGTASLISYWLMVAAALITRGVVKLFSSINYIAPLLAAGIFAFIICSTLNMTFALKVFYNGEEIGYIADESVFESAEKQMLGRIVFEDYIKPESTIPQFTIAAVKSDELLNEDSLTNELIKASGNELSQATGLYADDKFIGAVSERQELLALLSSIKNKYRVEDGDNEENSNEKVEFVKNVEARDGLYPVTSVVDIETMTENLNQEEEAERVYITVEGDAPILIAQKNGVPYSQIKALNPDIEKSLLVGQEVLVKKSVPVLEVKVVRTETEEAEVNFKIEQIQDDTKYQGYVKVTQKGKKGTSLVTSEVTYVDGLEVDRVVLDTRVTKEPINEKVVVGGKFPQQQLSSSAMNTSSNFIWPVAGGYVSCGINGYWGHTGMDIAANTGTAVYASAAGIVTKVAYNTTGYGYHIIISHGGGVETLYGHNSKIHVKVGQWVNQGQLIAAIGRTGRATGPHVHFEVRINGKYMNPANYVGTRCPY